MKVILRQFNLFIACTAAAIHLIAGTGHATTFVAMDQEQLANISDTAIIGTVTEITSGRDIEKGEILTDIRVSVEDVLFGVVSDEVVIREAGGRVGGDEEWNYGTPVFRKDERVMVFLSDAGDGTYHVTNMALGKFEVQPSDDGVTELVRDLGEGVQVLSATGELVVDPAAEVMPLADSIRQERRGRHDSRRTRPEPVELVELEEIEDMGEFIYLGSTPSRWFESDSGEPVVFGVDPIGDSGPLLGPVQSAAAIDDAFAAWTAVTGSALRLTAGAPLAQPETFAGCTQGNRIMFNDPFNEISDPVGCGGVLAVGGYCTSAETKVVNGTQFKRIRVGKVTFNNGWASCFNWNRCNLSEVATHEIGHAIGLGHSTEPNAIMRSSAYFNGRCTTLGSDDEDAARFMYPPSVVVADTPTPTRTPTVRPTRTPGTIVDTPTFTSTPTRTPTRTMTHTSTPTRTSTMTPDDSTPSPGGRNLRGRVRYFMYGAGVPSVNVHMAAGVERSAMTGADGSFEFTNVGTEAVEIHGAKSHGGGGSISALDAAYALQAVVGNRELTPLQKIACDATGDGSISPLDATRLLQRTLGSITTLPVAERCGTPWFVVPATDPATGMAVEPTLSPVDCAAGGFDVPAVASDVANLDFDAILFGDCNGGWGATASALSSADDAPERSRVRIGRLKKRGNTATLPVYVRSSRPYQSLDIDLRYDASAMTPSSVDGRRVSDRCLIGKHVVEPGRLRIAFASPEAVNRRNGVLLFVTFDLTNESSALSVVRPIEARIDEGYVRVLPNTARR